MLLLVMFVASSQRIDMSETQKVRWDHHGNFLKIGVKPISLEKSFLKISVSFWVIFKPKLKVFWCSGFFYIVLYDEMVKVL